MVSRGALGTFGLILAAGQAVPALAQETPAAEAEIVVTGTRLFRPELDSPNPLTSVSGDRLRDAGQTSTTDVLMRLPALVGSQGTTLAAGGNPDLGFGEAGVNLLNLRNLGRDRTLVLVDGKRHVAGIPDSAAVDINSIPQDLIERIDVMTGGASAIYGADGVSGVVNFMLKRDFQGLRLRLENGITARGDGHHAAAALTAGRNFAGGRGNVALAYEFARQDRIDSAQRDYLGDPARFFQIVGDPVDLLQNGDDPRVPDRKPTNDLRWADSAPDGAVDLDLDFYPDFTGSGRPYDLGTYLPQAGGATRGGSSTPIAGYYGDIVAQTERHAINLLASYEFSPAARLSFEGKYVRNTALSYGQPGYGFYDYLAPDNAYLIERFGAAAAANGAYLTRDHFDIGRRGKGSTRETFRAVLGLGGALGDHLRYELSYVYGATRSRLVTTNARLGDRFYAALDAVVDPQSGQVTCRINLPGETVIDPNNWGDPPATFRPGECRPLNLLGNGVASQAALDFIRYRSESTARLDQHVVGGQLTGDLGAFLTLPVGPIRFAIGAEYRRESSRFTPDPQLAAGMLLNSAAVAPTGGGFDVKEGFAEISLPILKDRPGAQLLALGAAVRVSDYSSTGSTLAWKFDALYAPVPDIRFRGTLSRAVRAPNIGELYSPASGTFLPIDDPCDSFNLGGGTQFRQANCATLLAQAGLTPQQIAAFNPSASPQSSSSILGVASGNPALREETARTWTAGVVLTPRFLPGLSFSLDWYDIRIDGAVNTPSAQNLTELCVDSPTTANVYCANVTRAPGTGFVDGFHVQPQNVSRFDTAGFDAALKYRRGRLSAALTLGYLDKLEFAAVPGAVPVSSRGAAYAPRWQAAFDLDWRIGPVSLGYSLDWFERTRRYGEAQIQGQPDIAPPQYLTYKARWNHDLRFAVDAGRGFTLYGGINNLTDAKPDYDLFYPNSAIGRSFFLGVKLATDKLP
jgi:outer membrane receptor protein involved in Fe transport